MKICLKYAITSFLVLCAGLFSAKAMEMDTLSIPEVKVTKSRTLFYNEDQKVLRVDSGLIVRSFSSNLDELISKSGAINIYGYGGKGSLSSISLRGTASSHTNVLWNGFPLNSVTTGTVDLSLIPTAFFNNIQLVYGSSGSLYGSGTFGGSIELNNEVDWSDRFVLKGSLETGSFGSISGGVDMGIGGRKVRYDMSLVSQNARNDFPFTDNEKPGSPTQISEHNSLKSFGLFQKISANLPDNNYLEVAAWYQVKNKEVPRPMGSYGESLQSQSDSSLKVFAKWKKLFLKTSLEFKMGYNSDYLRYIDKKPDIDGEYIIDSEISTQQGYFDVNSRFFHFRNLTIDVGGNLTLIGANISSFTEPVNEYRANIIASAKYQLNQFRLLGSVRQNFNPFNTPSPLVSFGINYHPLRWDSWVKANVSNRFRLPGLNDKYWQPGGNPDLLPETGWSMNVGGGTQILNKLKTGNTLKFELDAFSGWINDWIQWVPGNGYWSPVNYKKVWSRGLEIGASFNFIAEKLSFSIASNYSLTFSTVEEIANQELLNKQLRYVPKNIIINSLYIEYQNVYATIGHKYFGERFTTENNDPVFALDPFSILDLTLGYSIGKILPESFVQIRVTNILNEEYQMIRSYPMPGRAWYLGLVIGINNKMFKSDKLN